MSKQVSPEVFCIYNFRKIHRKTPVSKSLFKQSCSPPACDFFFIFLFFFFKLGFTTSKAEQPLQGLELQEKEAQKDYSIQEICLE